MLAEYVEKSLVLLKRYICCHIKDIIYINLNTWDAEKKVNVTISNNPFIRRWLQKNGTKPIIAYTILSIKQPNEYPGHSPTQRTLYVTHDKLVGKRLRQ